jgi:hypothetical protein
MKEDTRSAPSQHLYILTHLFTVIVWRRVVHTLKGRVDAIPSYPMVEFPVHRLESWGLAARDSGVGD